MCIQPHSIKQWSYLMINIHGVNGGLLTIGKFDLLDNSFSLPCDTLVIIQSGLYPFFQPRRIQKCTTIRFHGEILYQSNKLQDHLMLPPQLQPDRAYGMYSAILDKDNPEDVAYILADLDSNIAVISKSFYHLCRYAQDYGLFKVNGILINQSKVYAQQSPKLNLSEELLGHNLEKYKFEAESLYDFAWGDEYTPSIVAYVDHGNVTSIPFGEEHTGSILGVGNFKTWRVTAFNDVPVNHLTNVRHLVLDIKVTEIAPRDFLCNTVTTPAYLDMLISEHEAHGMEHIHITSETHGGLPIFIIYNIEKNEIEECIITYSPQVLADYINAKFQNYLVVNTPQENSETPQHIEKEDRFKDADFLLKLASQKNQTGETSGEYDPNADVVELQKDSLKGEQQAEHARTLDQQ